MCMRIGLGKLGCDAALVVGRADSAIVGGSNTQALRLGFGRPFLLSLAV